MKKGLRSSLKLFCFVSIVLLSAQLTSLDSFTVVIPRMEVLFVFALVSGLAVLLIRE